MGNTSGGHQHLEGSSITESKAPSSSKTKRVLHGNLNPVASFISARAASLLQKSFPRVVNGFRRRTLALPAPASSCFGSRGRCKGCFSLRSLSREKEEEECRSLLQHVMRISGRKYSCSHTEEKAYRSSELSTFTQTTRSHIKSHGSKAVPRAAGSTQASFAPAPLCPH